jgi:hypothetical protein
MAHGYTIRGTGEELITHLLERRTQRNLVLFIPDEETPRKPATSYPEGAPLRNGAPLLPTEGRTQAVTPEQVYELLEEQF